MSEGSNRAEIRNPVLGLPSARLLLLIPDETRLLLAALLIDLSSDACTHARTSWDKRKLVAAAYWATVAVYAGHIARALMGGARRWQLRKPFRITQRGYPDLMAAHWADASRLYCARRDELGLGASQFPEALVFVLDIPVGRISYNGRIWAPGEWQPDDVPLYDNRARPA